ncbi:MAG: type II secretion system secretin GspD [Pseudomonadota bacterium]
MIRLLRRAALLVAVTSLFIAPPSLAQDSDQEITPNFKDVDIRQVIEAVSDVTGKSFLIDARVKGNVTMISETGMSPEDFYQTFLSILQIYGFVAVPTGNVVKVIPDTNARQFPVPTGSNLGLRGDDIVTEVIRVENVGAAQLVPILRPLVPQYGHLAAHPASNMLILADRAANVKRLKRIIQRIDQSSDDDIEVIRMENASATEIVRIIQTLSQSGARNDGAATPLGLVADERTNSVLLSGERSQRLRFRTLIAHLDEPIGDDGDTQVIYLRYANAEDLATKLNEQVRGVAQGGPTGGAGGASSPAGQLGANGVVIWSDADTNALIITAPPKIMRNLRSVINKIDIRRAQVHVEAMLVEVIGDDDANLGITWLLDGRDKGPAIAATDFGQSTPSTVSAAAAALSADTINPATLAGVFSPGITVGVGRFRDEGTNFGAILNALSSNNVTNVLSTPSIVTMDNEEAEVNIGEEVPFLTGSFSNAGGNVGGGVNPFQTIQREDVGIKLKITPQINNGDAVIMNIELEASSVNEVTGNAVDLRTSQRQFTQRVIVDDGGVLILGGLIDDQVVENESRVPLLSSIPILGNAFRTRSTNVDKRNLMVFIRPKIIRDGIQASIETGAKYNYIRDIQLGNDADVQLMPSQPRPVIPTLEDAQQRGFVFDRDIPGAIDLRGMGDELVPEDATDGDTGMTEDEAP